MLLLGLKARARWCISSTLWSLYCSANGSLELIKNALLVPVCPMSWPMAAMQMASRSAAVKPALSGGEEKSSEYASPTAPARVR